MYMWHVSLQYVLGTEDGLDNRQPLRVDGMPLWHYVTRMMLTYCIFYFEKFFKSLAHLVLSFVRRVFGMQG